MRWKRHGCNRRLTMPRHTMCLLGCCTGWSRIPRRCDGKRHPRWIGAVGCWWWTIRRWTSLTRRRWTWFSATGRVNIMRWWKGLTSARCYGPTGIAMCRWIIGCMPRRAMPYLISPSRSLPYNRPAMRCDTVVAAGRGKYCIGGRLVGVHVVGRSVRRAPGGFASALRAAPRNRNPARRLKWAESSSIHEVLHGKY